MLKRFIPDNIKKIISWIIASLASGSISTVIVKLYEKKIFGKVSLAIVVLIGIVIISIVFFAYQFNKKIKEKAKTEYNQILIDIASILHLKDWDNFLYSAGLDFFSNELFDEYDQIVRYKESKSPFWSKNDKKLRELLIQSINNFESMYTIIGRHLKSSPDGDRLYIEKFYSKYDFPERKEKEDEYDEYIKYLWNSIEIYCDSLNQIVNYVHKKNYAYEKTAWEGKFLYSYNKISE